MKSMRCLHTSEILDVGLRASAETVDELIGKKGDRHVTDQDLVKVTKLLDAFDSMDPSKRESSPLARYSAAERARLRDDLHWLPAFLHGPPKKHERELFCASLAVSAISDAKTKACAEIVAQHFGKGASEITFDELGNAKNLAHKLADDASYPVSADIKQAHHDGVFKTEVLERIEIFMRTGKGGLVSHGPVHIAGLCFDDVYHLPLGATCSNLEDTDKLAELIADYERAFARCGYDRIYIKGFDGRLYVALHCGGKLDRVGASFRAQRRGDTEMQDCGTVLFVSDVPNTMREATFGMWNDLLRRAVAGIRGHVGSDFKTKIQDASTSVGSMRDRLAGDAVNWRNMLWVGGVVAGTGAAFMDIASAVGIIAGTGGAVTLSSIVDYFNTPKDKLAIYQATGVNTNRKTRIRY